MGGVFALIGAFTYAELDTNFDESDNSVFLSKLIHPLVEYVYVWISLTVGFTTPIAISEWFHLDKITIEQHSTGRVSVSLHITL